MFLISFCILNYSCSPPGFSSLHNTLLFLNCTNKSPLLSLLHIFRANPLFYMNKWTMPQMTIIVAAYSLLNVNLGHKSFFSAKPLLKHRIVTGDVLHKQVLLRWKIFCFLRKHTCINSFLVGISSMQIQQRSAWNVLLCLPEPLLALLRLCLGIQMFSHVCFLKVKGGTRHK